MTFKYGQGNKTKQKAWKGSTQRGFYNHVRSDSWLYLNSIQEKANIKLIGGEVGGGVGFKS